MTDTPLSGLRILVVEDDYFIAADTEKALAAAGADVVGPCGDEDGGLDLVRREAIDCAVLDVNLGLGPSFGLADALRSRGIPFLFVTGYDHDAIPTEYSSVQRLQKPYVAHQLLGAVGRLV